MSICERACACECGRAQYVPHLSAGLLPTQFSRKFTDLTYHNNHCGLAAAFDAFGKLFIVVPGKNGVVTGYTSLTIHNLPAHDLSWCVETRCGFLAFVTDRVGLMFSSATASVTQDMLLLSGSGVVTLVNTTTRHPRITEVILSQMDC